MVAFSFDSKGDFDKTDAFLRKISRGDIFRKLDAFAKEGVVALSAATPVDSSLTAASWDYKVKHSRGSYSIVWTNSHIEDGTPIAIILQYGHGTGSGGYVQGRDYINPAMKPIFDKIETNVRKAVTSA